MQELLIQAIQNKQLISFNYHGRHRTAEVYVLGMNEKNDFLVRCFELPTGGWKLFHLSKMKSVRLLNRTFNLTRSDYNRFGDKAIKTVITQI